MHGLSSHCYNLYCNKKYVYLKSNRKYVHNVHVFFVAVQVITMTRKPAQFDLYLMFFHSYMHIFPPLNFLNRAASGYRGYTNSALLVARLLNWRPLKVLNNTRLIKNIRKSLQNSFVIGWYAKLGHHKVLFTHHYTW